MSNQITEIEFRYWLKDPVTLAIMQQIQNIDDYTKRSLEDPNVLLGSQINIAKLVGIREGLNQILDIQLDDQGERE